MTEPTPSQGRYPWRAYLSDLWGVLKGHWRHCLLMLLAIALQLLFALLFPLGLQWIFDGPLVTGDLGLLLQILGLLIAGFMLSALAAVGQDYLASRVGAETVGGLRARMFRHMQRLPVDFFHRVHKSDLMSRFSTDLAAIESAVTRGVPLGLYYASLILFSTLLLFFIEWQLALAVLVAAPLLSLGPQLFGGSAARASYARKQQDAAVAQVVQESIRGQQIIRIFDLEALQQQRFAERQQAWLASTLRMNFHTFLVGRLTVFSMLLLILLIVGLGAYLSIEGRLTVGALLAFVGLLLNLDEGFRGMSESSPFLMHSVGSLQRVGELFDEPTLPVEVVDAGAPALAGDICLRAVTFGYDPGRPNLVDIDMCLPSGCSMAFVGSSGSGKSTLLSLITRAYEPQQGGLYYGDRPFGEIPRGQLGRQFSMVLQETFLFNISVMENIRMGLPGASDAAVIAAAQAAEADTMIRALPQGYDTLVGEDGGSLSGGQRQRLAIARAILRNPPVLLLDEATSALDPGTEAAINQTLTRLAKRCTLISVTHRLASVVEMDRIFVLDQGRLVEQGDHSTLLAQQGFYHQLWHKQSGFSLSDDGRHAEVTVERLQSVPLLAGLATEYLETIRHKFRTDRYEVGAAIIHQGEVAQTFHFIVRGLVEVVTAEGGPEGQQRQPVARLEIGDYFGEIGLLCDSPTTATVRALLTTTTISLTREAFHELLFDNQELLDNIRAVMQARKAQLARGEVGVRPGA